MDVFNTYRRAKRYNLTHLERKVDPTVTDDTYRLGTMWVNLETQRVWVCTDTTKGAAIWTEVDDIDQLISDLVALDARVTINEGDIITNAGNIATNAADILDNASDILDLQGAVGSVDEASIDYSSNNYVTDGEDTVTAIGDLDAELKTARDVTDNVGSAAYEDVGIGAGNVPQLNGSGKLETSVIPSIALTDVYVVNTIVERDALTVQEGDICNVVADPTPANNRWYIYDGASWLDFHPTYVAASEVTYDNSVSGLVATNAQTAIDELESLISSASGSDITTFYVDLNAAGGGDGSKATPFNSTNAVAAARNAIPTESVRIYYYSTGATVSNTQTTAFTNVADEKVHTEIIGLGVDTNGYPRMVWDDLDAQGESYYIKNIKLSGLMDFSSSVDNTVIIEESVVYGVDVNSAIIYFRNGWIASESSTTCSLGYGEWHIEGTLGVFGTVTQLRLAGSSDSYLYNVETSIPIFGGGTTTTFIYNSTINSLIETDSGRTLEIYNSSIDEIDMLVGSSAVLIAEASRIATLTSSSAGATITLRNHTVVNSYTNTAGTTITLDEYSGVLHHTENDDSSTPLLVTANDIDDGYSRGAIWINDNKAYVCTDNTQNASRWRQIAQDRYSVVEVYEGAGGNIAFDYVNKGSLQVINTSDDIIGITLNATATANLAVGDWIEFVTVDLIGVTLSTAGGASVYGTNPIGGAPTNVTDQTIRITLVATDSYLITLY